MNTPLSSQAQLIALQSLASGIPATLTNEQAARLLLGNYTAVTGQPIDPSAAVQLIVSAIFDDDEQGLGDGPAPFTYDVANGMLELALTDLDGEMYWPDENHYPGVAANARIPAAALNALAELPDDEDPQMLLECLCDMWWIEADACLDRLTDSRLGVRPAGRCSAHAMLTLGPGVDGSELVNATRVVADPVLLADVLQAIAWLRDHRHGFTDQVLEQVSDAQTA